MQLAEHQLGHVTRAQLLALGATPGWIRSQVRLSWLVRVHAGVYAIGHVPRGARPQAMAAVLACGPAAALSHGSAAALWGVAGWPALPEVSSPGYHRRPGIATHRRRALRPREIRTHQGIRTTTPVRTILDVAPRLTDARLARAVNDLRVAGHLGPTAFAELCAGSVRIERRLGGAEAGFTRSGLEDLFCRFVGEHDLPMPAINARLPGSGREVDALYREARLIVEVDSWSFHGDRAAFERDRAKDAHALAAGYRTIRTTRQRLSGGGGAQEAATIRAILAGGP